MKNQPKYLFDKDPWMLAEDIPEIDFQFFQIWLSSFVNDLQRSVGRNYKKILGIFKGYSLKFYYGEKDSNEFGNHILKLLIKHPKFGQKINNQIRIYSDKLKHESSTIEPKFLKDLSNQELARLYLNLDRLHTDLYIWGWLPNAVDMFHGNFTNYCKSILAKKLSAEKVNEALVILSTSPEKSIFNLEHESFLKLVMLKQAKVRKQKLELAIRRHLSRFFYLKHLWLNLEGLYTYGYYVHEINKFIKTGEDAKELLAKENKILRETISKRTKLVKRIKLSSKEIALFDVYAEFAVTKAYRRDAQIYWAYKMDFIFAELARRLKLSVMQARFMFPSEVIEALAIGKVSADLKQEIAKRTKYCVYYAEKELDKIFYGTEAQKLEAQVAGKNQENITELSGQTACLGKAKGIVRIINSISEIRKMKQGDILVSIATNPDIVPAMKKAAAIVTEQGGITSHAAIVSRELGVPCIIGTKIATKVFKDGDIVEVDANKGIITILK